EDMAVAPGLPETVAIARRDRAGSSRAEGVAIYDNGIPRRLTTAEALSANKIQFSGSPQRLYAFKSEYTDGGLYRMVVTLDGVEELDSTPGLSPGLETDIRYADGLIYTTTGRIIDPEARAVIGRCPG